MRNWTANDIYALAVSLDMDGQREPILVRPVEASYEVIRGDRRARAAQNLGWIVIEAYVLPCDPQTALILALNENIWPFDPI